MAINPIITGVYDQSINRIDGIISGQVILTVHTHGIRMEHGLRGKFDIHNSQIIDINFMTAPTVEEINRSVITGAAIGGVL